MKFSVLLPTRNRLDLLSRAIETVCRQDYDDWEIIVSDNYSEEDIEGFVNSIGDSRIRYFRTKSFIPVTDNWNSALDNCTGEYIVMLGDDDCLMKGYFSTLRQLIIKFDSPDFIYTNAFLYAYPSVMPTIPDGFLRTYGRRKIFNSASEPFWLERNTAIEFVKDSLDFKVTFDYNMQFSIVSRKLVEEMKQYGQFFQSPYPDYYASNAIMLKSKRILIMPQPMVTIGISPKSFGCYYFNDAENKGHKFLNNLPDKDIVSKLQGIILPGVAMNTTWLLSMETLCMNLGSEFNIKVNYSRYRKIQIFATYAGVLVDKKIENTYQQLKKKMSIREWIYYGIFFSVITCFVPKRYRENISYRILTASGSHPGSQMPDVEGAFRTIIDVFEQIEPYSYVNY